MRQITTKPLPLGTNFNVGQECITSSENTNLGLTLPPPPEPGYFLELAGPPLALLDGQDMTLL